MARPRVIDQNDILDAAEVVVIQKGAALLTLEAVAHAAGISKASVIYDCKTKQQLIKAVVIRAIDREKARIQAKIDGFGKAPNATIKGLIAAATDVSPDNTRAAATNLSSALAQDAELRGLIEQFYNTLISSVMNTSENPQGGLLAFLALEGLRTLEWHNYYCWPSDQRQRILHEISQLFDDALPDLNNRP